MAVVDPSNQALAQLFDLGGRTAVVTGGAMGIGAAIADRLAEAGAAVLIGDVDEVVGRATASAIGGRHGVKVVAAHVDVADAGSVVALANRAVAEFGGIDIWVNNAGIYPAKPVLELADEDWDKVLDVNLRGTFIGCREAARRMVAAGRAGVIVNIDSTAGFRAGGAGVAHYVTSKHAVRGLTKSLAVELGPHGIRVLAVAPTLIETPGIEHLAAGGEMQALLDQLAARLPVGRVGVPDDIARIVLFCASDASALMTGSTLLADGGDLAL